MGRSFVKETVFNQPLCSYEKKTMFSQYFVGGDENTVSRLSNFQFITNSF